MTMQGKMTLLMGSTAKSLRGFLERNLPQDRSTWWKDFVVTALSFQQQKMIEQQRITTLAQLDLAALLRVLDQNWHIISSKCNLPSSDRNFVKEMFSVRNRWAHISTAGIADDDAYRDLDTLQRFAAVLNAEAALIDAIKTAKSEIRPPAQPIPAPSLSVPLKVPDTEFAVGQIVSPKANPALTGAIIQVLPGKPENRYTVFQNATMATYYASQLQASQPVVVAPTWLSLSDFHAGLTSIQICDPSLSTLFSLNAAKVDFVPYQYRPVLKFIRSDRPRLLIADGVGVGKTIEAGLILRELQAREDVQKVLIICPKPLVVERKWELEMKRFDERFVHLDGKALRYCISEMDLDGEWSEQHSKAIVPYSLFDETLLHGDTDVARRRRKGLLDLDPPPHFDLVIVDEAHRIRNAETYTY